MNNPVATTEDKTRKVELPTRDRGSYKISLYTDSQVNYRWRMIDKRNNKIVDAASQGFAQEATAVTNCYLSTGFVPDGWVLSGVRET